MTFMANVTVVFCELPPKRVKNKTCGFPILFFFCDVKNCSLKLNEQQLELQCMFLFKYT